MRAGRLRHRLYLQQQSNTRDSYGGEVVGWSTTATVWGAVEALSGSEKEVAGQIAGSIQVRIVIRHDTSWSAIDNTWRVKDANTARTYDIHAVILPEHRSRPNTVIELMCFEGETDDE